MSARLTLRRARTRKKRKADRKARIQFAMSELAASQRMLLDVKYSRFGTKAATETWQSIVDMDTERLRRAQLHG